jgi:cytidine deaminase
MNEVQTLLFKLAKKNQLNSHSPYSKARIGAALLMQDGQMFGGCNIENASYGGTVCAERVAIWKAVSEGSKAPILEIMVVSSVEEAWPPCGFCRQVMAEFCTPKTLVHICNINGQQLRSFKFEDLLPESFTPSFLG